MGGGFKNTMFMFYNGSIPKGREFLVDWKAIKTEYITNESSSYTKLSKKYGISRSTIANRAGREHWATEKERYRNDVVTKTIASVGEKQVDKMTRIQDVSDKLLEKIEQAIKELDLHLIRKVEKTKTIEYNNPENPSKPTKEVVHESEKVTEVSSIVDRTGLKAITSALRDIKEIQMLKSELDKREQEARIAHLQKQAEKADDGKDVAVTMSEEVVDYCG